VSGAVNLKLYDMENAQPKVTSVNVVDSDLFARLRSLPARSRLDLLEFLGASAIENAQIEKMIDDLSHSIEEKRRLRLQKAN